MEPEENRIDAPQPAEEPENSDTLNPIGRAMIALLLGICIVLILNILNRGGWFALLSALFGMLLYGALVILQWLSGRNPNPKKPHPGPVGDGPEAQRAAVSALGRGSPLVQGARAPYCCQSISSQPL